MTNLNDLFRALSDRRRRHVLYVLRQRDRPVPVEQLTEYLYEMDRDRPGDPPAASVHEIHSDLVEVHLPELRRDGLVEYDPETEIVALDRVDAATRTILDLAWRFEMRSL